MSEPFSLCIDLAVDVTRLQSVLTQSYQGPLHFSDWDKIGLESADSYFERLIENFEQRTFAEFFIGLRANAFRERSWDFVLDNEGQRLRCLVPLWAENLYDMVVELTALRQFAQLVCTKTEWHPENCLLIHDYVWAGQKFALLQVAAGRSRILGSASAELAQVIDLKRPHFDSFFDRQAEMFKSLGSGEFDPEAHCRDDLKDLLQNLS